ncbi:MAG: hypothetical protein P4L40_01400, partial [Terracidiphilus sp.]|nr:hypothetical protein [Terracidiphilus sp.]
MVCILTPLDRLCACVFMYVCVCVSRQSAMDMGEDASTCSPVASHWGSFEEREIYRRHSSGLGLALHRADDTTRKRFASKLMGEMGMGKVPEKLSR